MEKILSGLVLRKNGIAYREERACSQENFLSVPCGAIQN